MSPCKNSVDEFIRQGATNHNYLWIDSQDMTGVDKIPLKQISEWILGYQSEKNEVKHTLDQIPLPKTNKPKEEDIMMLGTGIFYYASRDFTTKLYVQPFWLDDEKAIQIAKGELKISEIDAPKQIAQNKIAIVSHDDNSNGNNQDVKDLKTLINKELLDMRTDFFNKIGDLQEQINKAFVDIAQIKTSTPDIDEDLLVSKVLQKMPTTNTAPGSSHIDIESITKSILSKIPKSAGGQVYEVLPLEKIQKDFLEEIKQKILGDIEKLSDNAKRLLKYLEAKGVGVKAPELEQKCFFMKRSGASAKKISEASIELRGILVSKKDTAGWHKATLKDQIQNMLGAHNATEQEIENLYQHILMELL